MARDDKVKRRKKNKKREGLAFSDSETESSEDSQTEQTQDTKRTKRRDMQTKSEDSTASEESEDDFKTTYEDVEKNTEEMLQNPHIQLFEPCLIAGTQLSLPVQYAQLKDPFQIFNLDTWNNKLTEEERKTLMQYLPQSQHLSTEGLLKDLFSNKTFFFSNPVTTFHNNIQKGIYHGAVAPHKNSCRTLQQQYHAHDVRLYKEKMFLTCRNFWKKPPQQPVNEETSQPATTQKNQAQVALLTTSKSINSPW